MFVRLTNGMCEWRYLGYFPFFFFISKTFLSHIFVFLSKISQICSINKFGQTIVNLTINHIHEENIQFYHFFKLQIVRDLSDQTLQKIKSTYVDLIHIWFIWIDFTYSPHKYTPKIDFFPIFIVIQITMLWEFQYILYLLFFLEMKETMS